jgi:adenylosuccinate synthase
MEKEKKVWTGVVPPMSVISAYLIMDGQWGSTGKGLIAGKLAMDHCPDGVVCNFGPNAGHTFITPGGEKVMTQQLPTGIVTPAPAKIFIGPGAIIDPDLMTQELQKFSHHLTNKKIFIHPRAALVLPAHKQAEQQDLGRISSTQKGTGAAAAGKVMRQINCVVGGEYKSHLPWAHLICTEEEYTNNLLSCRVLQIESAQGFELGLNQGYDYPHCTSRDVTPGQIMADCGIPHYITPKIIVSLRTFPIRVGHQFDDAGVQVGHSGPHYPDQEELTWGEGLLAGIEPERTTVTNKVRRIFTFSYDSLRRMVRFVHPDHIFLNFTNYIDDDPDFDTPATADLISRITTAYNEVTDAEVSEDILVPFIGTGPGYADVKTR